jgi:uncharacterized membrane protein
MNVNQEKLADCLGWFSIGLGVAELLAPRSVGNAAGIRNHDNLLRVAGARELMSGIGILSNQRPAGWVWSRAAGDVMDLGMLGAALATAENHHQRRRAANALIAVAGVTAVDIYCGMRLGSAAESTEGRTRQNGNGAAPTRGRKLPLRESILIDRPVGEIYAFWRDLENLPRFMAHLNSVTVLDDKRSRWVAKGPAGTEVTWEAEIIDDKPNELIAWRSLPGSTIENAGTVRFEEAPGGRGTIVRVKLQYHPPAGAIGATVAKLFGEAPEKQIPVDLLRIKQLLETGEIARTDGQPAGRAKSTSRKYDDWLRA